MCVVYVYVLKKLVQNHNGSSMLSCLSDSIVYYLINYLYIECTFSRCHDTKVWQLKEKGGNTVKSVLDDMYAL